MVYCPTCHRRDGCSAAFADGSDEKSASFIATSASRKADLWNPALALPLMWHGQEHHQSRVPRGAERSSSRVAGRSRGFAASTKAPVRTGRPMRTYYFDLFDHQDA